MQSLDQPLCCCRWFSYDLNPTSAPWAFYKFGQAYRAIASLELFASLLCIMIFVPTSEVHRKVAMSLFGVTDNRGNESLILRNMSSKFPVYLVLLEVTEQLRCRNLILNLDWKCREQNSIADDLTNGRFEAFSSALRFNDPLDSFSWKVLPLLMKQALELELIVRERKDLRQAKSGSTMTAAKTPSFKRKAEGLKTREPW